MVFHHRIRGISFTALMLVFYQFSCAYAASEKTINDIIRSLAPIDGQVITKGYGGKTRKERIEDDDVILNYDFTEDLELYFPFDSAKITKRTRRQLNILGRALTSKELKGYRYLIAGHTDAKGTRQYNRQLSRRRAFAVKKYLVRNFPIPPYRLRAVGWGEDRLKNRKHPRAAINRRVQIIMIVSPRIQKNSSSQDTSHDENYTGKKAYQGSVTNERTDQPEVGSDGKLKIEW